MSEVIVAAESSADADHGNAVFLLSGHGAMRDQRTAEEAGRGWKRLLFAPLGLVDAEDFPGGDAGWVGASTRNSADEDKVAGGDCGERVSVDAGWEPRLFNDRPL